ncbi:MAG: hypothetical protein ACREPX_07680 [Rhodanobacteraceae bacterium]
MCIYDFGTLTRPIGAFPPGEYTLTVDFTYSDFLPEPAIVTLGIVPFTVAGSSAVAVPAPTLNPFALLTLMFALPLIAWFWRARQNGFR